VLVSWKTPRDPIVPRKIAGGLFWTVCGLFCGKPVKPLFSTSPVEYVLLITENFVEKSGVLSLQRKNQRNSKCSGENVRCFVKYISNPVPGIKYLKFFAYFLSRK
jgi:hypothetical protein